MSPKNFQVFEEDIQATPVANFGTVQHVTERPSFGISSASGSGAESFQEEPLPLESLFGNEEPSAPSSAVSPAGSASDLFKRPRTSGIGSVEVIQEAKKPSLLTRLSGRKGSAALDFKERLKNR